MVEGNRGLASRLADDGAKSYEPRRPPKAGFLAARDSRLAELASGGVTTRVHEAIDPAVCRIWAGHNRDYAALTEASCADLIASLRAEGRQEIPAIVRRVTDDPAYRFEVVCGARRHWSVSWLRAHDYPDFKFIDQSISGHKDLYIGSGFEDIVIALSGAAFMGAWDGKVADIC